MTTFIIIIHVLACILLCMVILMQSGRGGGLTESFASAESVFGARTNSFMVRTTTVVASIFLVTSLVLTYLSSRKEQSLMSKSSLKKEIPQPKGIPVKEEAPKEQTNVKEVQPQTIESAVTSEPLTNSTTK